MCVCVCGQIRQKENHKLQTIWITKTIEEMVPGGQLRALLQSKTALVTGGAKGIGQYAADISSLNCFHSADFLKNYYPLVPQEVGNYIDMPLDIESQSIEAYSYPLHIALPRLVVWFRQPPFFQILF